MSSAALSCLAVASSAASMACLRSAMLARRVELVELASTVVSLEFLLGFLEVTR